MPYRIGVGTRLPAGAAERMVTAAMANPFRENNRRVADADELRALLAGVPALGVPR